MQEILCKQSVELVWMKKVIISNHMLQLCNNHLRIRIKSIVNGIWQTNGTSSDNEWQRVVQQMKTNDNEWQRMTASVNSDNEWQQMTVSGATYETYESKKNRVILSFKMKKSGSWRILFNFYAICDYYIFSNIDNL